MKKKGSIIVTVCAVCIACIAVGMYTVLAVQQIPAELHPEFTVFVDGREQTFHDANGNVVVPILYDGTTYLPVRAIGELMNKDVAWDGAAKRIDLTEKQPDAAKPAPEDSAQTAPPTDGAQITAERAKEIALARAGLSADQVVFDRTETDVERGVLIYEIEFRAGSVEYSADVRVSDGEIVSWEVDHDFHAPADAGAPTTATPSASAAPTATVTEDQARQIALDKAGLTADQVQFERTELDRERGELVYEVSFHQGRVEYSADVRASDGKILSWEVDRD